MIWPLLAIIILLVLLVPTAYAGFLAAPYVPTRGKAIQAAIAWLGLSSDDLVVDLGSGDGAVLVASRSKGARVVGYELSPIMWFVSLLRLRRPGSDFFSSLTPSAPTSPKGSAAYSEKKQTLAPQTRLILGNFFKKRLPKDTTIVFSFLMPKAMPKVLAYLKKQDLLKAKLYLTYMFPLPENVRPLNVIRTEKHGVVYVYDFADLTKGA